MYVYALHNISMYVSAHVISDVVNIHNTQVFLQSVVYKTPIWLFARVQVTRVLSPITPIIYLDTRMHTYVYIYWCLPLPA